MTTDQKINDATNRVILAIQRAALDPDSAKQALAVYGAVVRHEWEDYFTMLLSDQIELEESVQSTLKSVESEV